ncbi:MAG: peptide chain release factor N(5)-glutamine methyltransferase [Paracoccaceae bacterium]
MSRLAGTGEEQALEKIDKPDELLALHGVTEELFDTLKRWFDVADEATISLADADSAVEEFGEPGMIAALAMRKGRAPLSHIVGGREFWGRWILVTPDVLDPRPETETLIAAALGRPETVRPPGRVLDLGVGSGAILGTVLAESPEATGVGVDASRAALAVAKRNMEALGVAARADLRLGDWFDGVEEGFDLILCNPPYIAEEEMAALSEEVRGHEPHLALTPGGDGLAAYRRIAPELAVFLRRRGRALFEIGPTQAEPVAKIFGAFGWPAPIIHRDMDGRDRCLEYRRKA